jgi:hypothetical protein
LAITIRMVQVAVVGAAMAAAQVLVQAVVVAA